MFSNPEQNVNQMGLMPGAQVVDLGAGVGTYTIPIAKAVAGGKVYAVDVQRDLLVKLKNTANQMHVTNVEVIVGDLEKISSTGLRDGTIDVVLAANVFFQINSMSRKLVVQEMKRILKKNGRAIIIDWKESFGNIGPRSSDIFGQYKAKELFRGEGFVIDRTISAGDHHYGIIFKKTA